MTYDTSLATVFLYLSTTHRNFFLSGTYTYFQYRRDNLWIFVPFRTTESCPSPRTSTRKSKTMSFPSIFEPGLFVGTLSEWNPQNKKSSNHIQISSQKKILIGRDPQRWSVFSLPPSPYTRLLTGPQPDRRGKPRRVKYAHRDIHDHLRQGAPERVSSAGIRAEPLNERHALERVFDGTQSR